MLNRAFPPQSQIPPIPSCPTCPRNEEPRFAEAKRGSSLYEGELSGSTLLAELGFEVLTSGKLYVLGSFDLDLVTGLRIHAGTCFTSSDLECTEANQLNRAAFLQATLDSFDYGIERTLSLSFAGFFTEAFLDSLDEFCLVHEKVVRVERSYG